jgi:hypothetical protein
MLCVCVCLCDECSMCVSCATNDFLSVSTSRSFKVRGAMCLRMRLDAVFVDKGPQSIKTTSIVSHFVSVTIPRERIALSLENRITQHS